MIGVLRPARVELAEVDLERIARECRLAGEAYDLLERAVELEDLALGSTEVWRGFVVQAVDVCPVRCIEASRRTLGDQGVGPARLL